MNVSKFGVLGLGIVAALGVTTPGFSGGNKYGDVPATRDCGDGDSVDWLGPIMLWPPNHKFVTSTVAANGGTDGEMVSIAVFPTLTDVAGGDGGAQHDPDFQYESEPTAGTDTATQDVGLRAERSGKGEGRTYRVGWTATFDNGGKSCTSEGTDPDAEAFFVNVPHDMRDKNN